MVEETKILLAQLDRALKKLEKAVNLSGLPDKGEIDITIYRFKFAFEFFWETLETILKFNHSVVVYGAKSVLQQTCEHELINEKETALLQMFYDQNHTRYCYEDELATQIYYRIKTEHFPLLKRVFEHVSNN